MLFFCEKFLPNSIEERVGSKAKILLLLPVEKYNESCPVPHPTLRKSLL